jgi:hypothetical protein
MALSATCIHHPAVQTSNACTTCRSPHCDHCLAFAVDGQLACVRCATAAAREGRPRFELAGAFLLAGAGALWALIAFERRQAIAPSYELVAFAAAALLAVAGWLVWPRGTKRVVTSRAVELESVERALSTGTDPYRGGTLRVRLPGERPISGRAVALLLVGTFVATAFAVPFSLHLPHWLESEIVLATWGGALASVLIVLLYRGRRVADDHRLALDLERSSSKAAGRGGRWALEVGANGSADPEGCVGALFIALLVLVSLAAAWLVVELVAPLFFFLAYMIVLKAVARVANDSHACHGALGRAVGWGLVWTGVYFGPFALLVWIAHMVVRMRTG